MAYENSRMQVFQTTSSATGANWITLGTRDCNRTDLLNAGGSGVTSVDVEWRINSGTSAYLPANGTQPIVGISNSNQVSWRRKDQSNTQYVIPYLVLRVNS